MAAGVYLHIPFCRSRCSYCDFATDVYRDGGAVERYVAALGKEIRAAGVSGSNEDSYEVSRSVTRLPPECAEGSDVDTIYLGGGTPSLLTPSQLGEILDAVHSRFTIEPGAEITMEMNPATVSAETLAAYKDLGINRASFGVQTFNDRDLKLLARGHDSRDAHNTFDMLRTAGFENVSFDLIAGLPDQTMDDWQSNLDEAVRLSPEHISLYLLEIHSGTPLAEQVRSGRRKTIDEELAAEMYEVMIDRLAAVGYRQYEISNFSRPGYESRHNSKYWTLDPIFGFGVSAHSFDGSQRFANERDTARYVSSIEAGNTAETMREEIDLASEFIFLGLRLENGIDLVSFEQKFGFDLRQRYSWALNDLKLNGLIDLDDKKLRLTRKGKLFSNEVFAVFV